MIYAGTDLKFKVTARGTGFNPSEDNFYIVVKNRWGQRKLLVGKEDMLTDEDGNFYFCFPKAPNGVYHAEFYAEKPDTNFEEDVQTVVDCTYLCTVAGTNCSDEGEHMCIDRGNTDGLVVVYERCWWVGIGDGSYLVDCYGNPILSSEGEYIYLKPQGSEDMKVHLPMSGDEVVDLLSGHNDNGKIDTIPELIDTAGGIDENTEVSIMTEQDADDMMNRILGR